MKEQGAPKITIITVVWNDALNLCKTIASVLTQSYPNKEFIIIDGGSTDDTLSVIKSNVENLSHWQSEPDRGIYDAMNKGLASATGDYVNFLNAGDKFAHRQVLSQIAEEITRTSADIIYGQSLHKNSDRTDGYIKGSRITRRALVRTVPFCHQALFTKRTLFETIGLYDLNYPIAADYDWMLRYSKSRSIERMHFVPTIVVEYNSEGFSFRNISRSVVERKRLTDTHFKNKFRLQRNANYLIDLFRVWTVKRLAQSGLIHCYRRLKYYRRSTAQS